MFPKTNRGKRQVDLEQCLGSITIKDDVGVEELGDIDPKIFKMFAIDNLSNDDWTKQITEFLNNQSGTAN